MKTVTRRRLLSGAAVTAAAVGVAPSIVMAKPGKRSERVRVGVIGVRGRGRGHIGGFKASPDAEVTAIIEVDEGVLGPARQAVPDAVVYRDLREALAADAFDAVTVATPNHWHSLCTLWALQAGKHVYVEKPLSHVFVEGRDVVELARASGLVVQHGTQARTSPATIQAVEYVRSGALGRVHVARALCYKRRESIGKVEGEQTPPETLDYDLWTGPAALQPLRRKSLHYDWHWDRNTGNGDLGNQGVHQMDIARWGLSQDGFPTSVQSVGGRFGYDDDGNTPNTQVASFAYADDEGREQRLVFEVRGLPTVAYRGQRIGNVFHCEGGSVVVSDYSRTYAYDRDGRQIESWQGSENHYQNFLDAVVAGDPSRVNALPQDGHLSSGLCHLANASYWLGEEAPGAGSHTPFGADPAGNEAWDRTREHLAGAGVAEDAPVRVGPELPFDAAAERFTGEHAERANAELTRPDRPPFVYGRRS
ncbi:MAG: Gfo/Idh/MocA family protein [Planctomycetota bacterium]|jgi:predicted dehydrogenase